MRFNLFLILSSISQRKVLNEKICSMPMVSKKKVNAMKKLYELQNDKIFQSINKNLLDSLKEIDEKLSKKDSDCQKCYADLMKEYGKDSLFMKKLNESKPSKLNENMHYILSVFIRICRKRCEGQEFGDKYMKKIMKAMDDYTLFMQKEIELHRYHEDANILKLNFTYLDELYAQMDQDKNPNSFLDNQISELTLRISSVLNGEEYDADKVEFKNYTRDELKKGTVMMQKAERKTNERLQEEVIIAYKKRSPYSYSDNHEHLDRKDGYVRVCGREERMRTNKGGERNSSVIERLARVLKKKKDGEDNYDESNDIDVQEKGGDDAVMNLEESISQSIQLVNPESVFQPTLSNHHPFMKLEFPKQFQLTSKLKREAQVIFLYHNLWTPSILEKNDVYEMKKMVEMILESKRIKMKEKSSTESSQIFTLQDPLYSKSLIPIDGENEDTDTSTIEFVSDQEPPSFFKARMVKNCLLLIIFLMGGLIQFTTFSKGFGALTTSFLTGTSPSEELKGIPLLSSSASAFIDPSAKPSLFQIMKMNPDLNLEVMGDSLVPLENGKSGYKLMSLDASSRFKFLPSLDESPIFIPSSLVSSGKEVSTLVRPSNLTTPNPNAPSTAMTVLQKEKNPSTPYESITLTTPSISLLPDSLPVVDNNNTKGETSKALTTFVRLPEMGQSPNPNAPGNQVAKQAGENNPEPINYLVPVNIKKEPSPEQLQLQQVSENDSSQKRKELSTSLEEEVGLIEGMSSNPNAPSKALARYLTENEEFKEAVNHFYETQIYVNTEQPVIEIPWLHNIVTLPPDPLPLTLPKSYEKALLQASKLKDKEKVIDAYEENLTLVLSASEMSPSIPSVVVQILREDTKNSSMIQDVVKRMYEIDIAVRSFHDIGSYLVSSFPESLQDNAPHIHSVLSHEYSSCFALHVLINDAQSFLDEEEMKKCVKDSVEALESGDLIPNMIQALDSPEKNSTLIEKIKEANDEVQDNNYNSETFDVKSLLLSLKAFFNEIMAMMTNKEDDLMIDRFFNQGLDAMTANFLLESIAKLASLLPVSIPLINNKYFRYVLKIIIKYIKNRYYEKKTLFESVTMSLFTKSIMSDSNLFLNMKVKSKFYRILSSYPLGKQFLEKMTESIRQKEIFAFTYTFLSGSKFPEPIPYSFDDPFLREPFRSIKIPFLSGMIPAPPSISM